MILMWLFMWKVVIGYIRSFQQYYFVWFYPTENSTLVTSQSQGRHFSLISMDKVTSYIYWSLIVILLILSSLPRHLRSLALRRLEDSTLQFPLCQVKQWKVHSADGRHWPEPACPSGQREAWGNVIMGKNTTWWVPSSGWTRRPVCTIKAPSYISRTC